MTIIDILRKELLNKKVRIGYDHYGCWVTGVWVGCEKEDVGNGEDIWLVHLIRRSDGIVRVPDYQLELEIEIL